ncbi:Pyruvate kinase II [Arsenophonus endosymbiont of Aleurodicus dispersus]|uniref:pyruvate kinase n=1 Tax=Arsenophonus endosymbiont of Aleurodicus dispersus TaxID=235559 RepID=UPI000EAB80E8|nr:pyruvate kinase [Arsenophonus endosymbiont of Aleurodicus dispersus]VAY02277.1 Pyruvate kinase II [Arsenophonus endosymbiont of Aleurodicus dispersus]
MSILLRRTKIVTTLGPATDRDHNLEKMIKAGVNVVRLNFSHGSVEDHLQRAQKVHELAKSLSKNIAILGDLQGPKIRISTFKEGKIFLHIGDKFILDTNLAKGEGNQEKVGIDYQGLPNDVALGDILLLDDGRVQLKVLTVKAHQILTEVTIGGPLSNNKGINKLGGGLSAEVLTKKDKADIVIAAQINVDYLAVSFPRSAEDLNYARQLAREAGCDCQIVAKVERAEAVANDKVIDEIILASDVIMVARGDLGVEIGDPELVGVQKKLICRARQLNRISITATQMMESMIINPIPTRAEVMDVANAVLDGTDAVMLSAETAVGKYPAETVEAMAKVCLGAEKMASINITKHHLDETFYSVEEAIAMSAMYAANNLKGVKAIIAMTESGRTACMMSRISSWLPIFSISCHEKTLNQCALYRGVTPIYCNKETNTINAVKNAIQCLSKKNYIESADLVLVTQGDQMGKIGSTNTCRILKVK